MTRFTQITPSLRNGVCVPQRRYGRGAIRDSLLNRDLVVFFRNDGSYLPVSAALEQNYADLIMRDIPTLGGTGHAITLRFEVKKP